LLDLFKTNELRITTRTSNKKIAIHIARKIANQTDLLFERLKNNKNMADDKDFTELNKTLEHWRVTNYLKTRLEEETNERFQEMVENKRRIKVLEASHEQTLAQQEASYKLAINAVSGLVLDKLNNRPTLNEVDLRLSALVEDFFSTESLSTRGDKPATIRKDKDAIKLFIGIVGDKNISEVTQIDAVKFAKGIRSFNLKGKVRAANTMNNFMSSVSKFTGWITSLHSETNHKNLDFSRLRYKKIKRSSDEREMLLDAEIRAIFSHPKFKLLQSDNDPKFWLISIAAYSGMRLEEITQLNPNDDIYKDEDGVWVFDINDNDDKSLKNLSAIRKIPIHNKLIEMNFLAYVITLQSRNANRLFPDTTIRDGRTGKNIGKVSNYFIQKIVGIQRKSLHSFRHSFATKLKQALIEESIVTSKGLIFCWWFWGKSFVTYEN
jgi:integrase